LLPRTLGIFLLGEIVVHVMGRIITAANTLSGLGHLMDVNDECGRDGDRETEKRKEKGKRKPLTPICQDFLF